MKVYIIGVGPGSEDYILPIARRQIEDSDCLIGARRFVSLFRDLGKEEVLIEGNINKVIQYIEKYKVQKRLAVLVSGDPGMYSLLEKVSKALKPDEYAVIPGISAVQLAFAKVGESWGDCEIISLHGRNAENLANRIKTCTKVFLFTDFNLSPNKIARQLLKEGLENRRAVVLENLSYPNERLIDTDLKALSKMSSNSYLCAMIIETSLTHRLYGIGLGPGDPKLVTLKAKEILERADTIFVPKGSEDGTSCARSIVEAVTTTQKTFVELVFPMTKDKDILNRYWDNAAREVANETKKRKVVAFVTIGDPFIYSTYVYLLKTLKRDFPDICVETIPGISAFNAAASRLNYTLVEGKERLAIVPATKDLACLRKALKEFDTVVLMKVGSKLAQVISILKELALIKNAVLISRLGHKDERIIYNLSSLRDKKAGYLSVIIVKR